MTRSAGARTPPLSGDAEQIAWDVAARELDKFDAGEQTYGHHAAEEIAKAIRALPPLSPWREAIEAAAKAVEEMPMSSSDRADLLAMLLIKQCAVDRIRSLSPPAASPWRDISSAPKGMKILLAYRNELGKWRTVLGCYYETGTLESEHAESGFAPPGWYEETEAYDEISLVDGAPTLWQLISPPAGDAG